MFNKIKNDLDKKLAGILKAIEARYRLKTVSPLLSAGIHNFILRPGKRIRPSLAVLSYMGHSPNPTPEKIRDCALSLELLHDFLLIHDDIIDDSDLRRGANSMHKMLESRMPGKNKKFGGKELAIVAGDCIYALAIYTLLASKIGSKAKELALRKLLETTVYTCGGEFAELILSAKKIGVVSKKDIYKIYDLKTAHYTFSTPLAMGAILAGARAADIDKISKYGSLIGRAFQIRDDALDMFGTEKEIGKKPLGDVKESKKTILLWYAYKKSRRTDKASIVKILSKNNPTESDLQKIRKIALEAGALTYAKREIERLAKQAEEIGSSLRMKSKYRSILSDYAKKTLNLKFADPILARALSRPQARLKV